MRDRHLAWMFLVAAVMWSCGGAGTVTPADGGDVQGEADAAEVRSDAGELPVDGREWKELPDGLAEVEAREAGEVPEAGETSCAGGEFECPCEYGDDCASGWCIDTADGKVCSMNCDTECPEGWICATVTSYPDLESICLPYAISLCMPCNGDNDCMFSVYNTEESYCVDYGSAGRFCGAYCLPGAQECPDGYDCLPVTSVGGKQVHQCVKHEGLCDCPQLAVEKSLGTTCYVETTYGKCLGTRECTEDGLSACSAGEPKPEECNFEDDDCNGKVDDGVPAEPCSEKNQWGECAGTQKCEAGEWACDAAVPEEEVCDGKDNDCDGVKDEDFPDVDGNGVADCVDQDDDGDGVLDVKDNCPQDPNPGQEDIDFDGLGDACDEDMDGDLIENGKDNCPAVANESQLDTNGDGEGDACDTDDDGDGVPDAGDNCALLGNPGQEDIDADGQGDVCDQDKDGDGVENGKDNCPDVSNAGQEDQDGDGLGNLCDGDDDADGVADETDNCPLTFNPGQDDFDKDGIGDACESDADGDGDPDATDCKPFDPLISHTAQEACDGLDNDCDDQVDEEDAQGCATYFRDFDQDGFGDDTQTKCLCEEKGVYTAKLGGDCNDAETAMAPGKVEACDQLDNDCDGETDEEGASDCKTWYLDEDGDQYGVTNDSKCTCTAAGAYTAVNPGDCNDGNFMIYPSAAEACNAADDDCNGKIDEEGAEGCQTWFKDADADGFGVTGNGKCLCQSAAPYTATVEGDCDDGNVAVFPGAAEVCDFLDNNCNGQVDEQGAGCVTYYKDGDSDGFGVSGDSKCLCGPQGSYTAPVGGDCNDGLPQVNPAAVEVCNGGDDDCNGKIDEEGATNCKGYYADKDQDGYGDPNDFKCLCAAAPPYVADNAKDCNDGDGQVYPSALEVCDGVDNNCNKKTDEGCDDDGDLYCDLGMQVVGKPPVCPGGGGDCNDNQMTIHPNADEKCNGVDDNCDGAVDNGPPAQLCAGLAHANPLCTNGNCVIESCLPHYYNINGVASDGCECGEDAYEALGGQTCSNPQDLGSFADDGTEMEVVGNIIPAGDVDWLVFKAVDSPDADCDHFHVDVRFTQNEAAEYTFDVFQNGCAEASLLCGSVTELTWNTDFYVHDANKKLGECPCSTAMSPPGETPGWSVPDKHYCQDQSRTFYIKIYRNPGKPVTCTPYKLRIKNGGFI